MATHAHGPDEADGATTVSREDVVAAVADWQRRLKALFASVTAWAASEHWRVTDAGPVPMHEEMMRDHGVPATEQPTLRLDRDGRFALFKPKGRWMIAANGRIDLYTSRGTFVLIDRAANGAPPRWTVLQVGGAQRGQPFEPALIADLV